MIDLIASLLEELTPVLTEHCTKNFEHFLDWIRSLEIPSLNIHYNCDSDSRKVLYDIQRTIDFNKMKIITHDLITTEYPCGITDYSTDYWMFFLKTYDGTNAKVIKLINLIGLLK